MLTLISFITLIVMILYCVISLRDIFYYKRFSLASFIILIFYFFTGIQLLLEMIIGKPNYLYNNTVHKMYQISSNDEITQIVYCIVITIITSILIAGGVITSNAHKIYWKDVLKKFPQNNNRVIKKLLLLIMLMPFILVLISPNPRLYMYYGYIRNHLNILTDEIVYTHTKIQNLTLFSAMVTGVFLIYTKKPKVYTFVFVILIGLADCYINGKRAVIVYFMASMLLYFIFKRSIKFYKLLIPAMTICVLFLIFNFTYLNKYKGEAHSYTNFEGQYYSFVNDFSRTGELRTEIYSELYKEPPILEYRGQSFLFNLLFFIPRRFWEMKPYPYSVYLTAADLMLPKPEPIGWGMTTNLFGEVLANFGFIGLIIFTIFLTCYCRFVDRSDSLLFRLVNIVFFIILNAVQLSAILPLYFIWFVLLLKNLPINRKKIIINKGMKYE